MFTFRDIELLWVPDGGGTKVAYELAIRRRLFARPRPVYTLYMGVSLKEVEALVDALEPTDQVRLLQYLVPLLADAVLAGESDRADVKGAWREFRRVGDRLAAASNGDSITQAISDMRR